MFTGLIAELGKVKHCRRAGNSLKLTVSARKVLSDLRIGDSVAVNGVCLTVVSAAADNFTVDVMPETAKSTSLPAFREGEAVNLERTVQVGGRLDGHIVTGHVDFVGSITKVREDDIARLISVRLPGEALRYIVWKGSVAVDGVSLTVVETGADFFTVSLIPHTAGNTTLGYKKTGDSVNVETDILGKYVEKLLLNKKSSLQGVLAENGFLEGGI